ncbi:MAG: EboA domain-containing protein [Planctomycetota bacterium]
MNAIVETLERQLFATVDERAEQAVREARDAAAQGVDSVRFGTLISGLSRPLKPRPLGLSGADLERAEGELADWTPERWNTLETARVLVILAHPELASDDFQRALEDAFTYADEGEQCALLKALPLAPLPERFVWRVGEACRSNMRTVFESAACDSPYAAEHFDDVAWKQALLKSLFVGAPLWRIRGLDRRLSADLARVALDYVEERRSAGRSVPHELWLCLGPHVDARAEALLESELEGTDATRRAAVGFALARAGRLERLEALAASETDPDAAELMRGALAGRASQLEFRAFDEHPKLEPVRN